jgi:Carboxypeptidase regulatory-like domain
MRPTPLYQTIVLVLFILCTAHLALAQVDTARLQGTITDPNNAVVPAVAVTVTNTQTSQVFSTTSNDLGYYTVSALPPGHYRVEVSHKAFKKVVRDLDLQVGQIAVADFQLAVGAVTESITVEAGSPVINPADSAIGDVVEGRQVAEMPLNGRNFTQLALLVPGVTRGNPTGAATGANNNAETFRFGQEGGASLAVNGLRPQNNNFILDGIDNNEALVNTIVFFPPADAIDEFRVQTSVAPAQFGRAGGALVVTSIKSGTNSYHGSAFWFNRNTNLNARNFFQGPPTPGFNRNQFGGTVGGPIIKNKLFLFGDYEGLRQKIPGSPEYATVPTDLMRQGDFSELLTTAGTGYSQTYTILDPSTGLQFMGSGSQPNVIPSNRLNSVGLAYIKAFPEPNCANAMDANCFSVYHNYKNTRKLIENWNDFDIRGDYILNQSNSFFVRFSRGRADQTDTTRLTTLPSGFGSGTNFNHPWGTAIGWTDTINPFLINEARIGFVRTTYGYTPPGNNTDICVQLGIVNCNTPLLGGIALIGGYNSQIEYTGDYGSYLVPQTGYNANDSLTWIKGKHTFKFGGNVIRRQLNLFRPLAGKGYFAIAGNGNSGCCGAAPGQGHVSTGYEVSDLLAGFVDGYAHGTTYGMVGTRSWENGFFAQDDYHVTPRLMLNLGLRYDVLTWPVEVQNRQANFDLTTGALVVAGSNGASRTLLPNDYHNFAPRLGFAYQLTSDAKTVLRGGFGLFYFLDRGGISNQLAQNPPFSGTNGVSYTQGYRITLSGSLPCEPTCTQSQLISTNATGPLPSGNFTNLNLATPTGVSVITVLPTNLTPMVSEWNLQIQRQIGTNQSVSLAYVGTHGARLTRNYNANQQLYGMPSGTDLYPNLGSITVQDNSGKSDYHSLQAQFERRFTRGLQFLGAFTWSKTIDDSCGNLDTCSPQFYKNYAIERGLSNQDQPYRLSLSSMYELPFGRGKRWGNDVPRALDYVIGGWQLNGIYTLQAGLPFSVTVDGNPSSTRADLVGTPSVNPGNIANYINPAAFAVPASTGGVFNAPGTSGRDILRGPGSSNMDLALFKNVSLTEQVKAQLRLQAYNLTNTPHFANPDSDFSHGTFGQINSVQPNSWRQVELGLRLTF